MPTECGGVIEPSGDSILEGSIETPNFGHLYPPNTVCVWEFKLNESDIRKDFNAIRIDVDSMDVFGDNEPATSGIPENNPGCPGDYIMYSDSPYRYCNARRGYDLTYVREGGLKVSSRITLAKCN